MKDRARILFLCTANSARSQLAEAILRDRADDAVIACSAGTRPSSVHPLAQKVLKEAGIGTEGLWSKSVDEVLADGPIDLTITVCSAAAQSCPAGIGETLAWPLDDPAAETGERALSAFRATRDAIVERIDAWLRDGGLARLY